MNKLRFFYFTEYDILQINILFPSFENLTAGYPKVNNHEQNTRKHKEHWFIPGDS